ncbi:glycosyltransferase family 2 protein [Tropicibacter oceani]|uniref:Glycosyltransferase family 2 protein n=1 Tax=Tropicibacter oceani TaxID=3058420 RepID=A0ABY8QF84_9RHOB|nr:glycosyltransferase family 2 protein [Tropicibacter oceani]WGW02658.1 glycosyltransferase family 2 protein [Tropicibacter oceani]
MLDVSIKDAGRLARVVSGQVDPARLTLFSTMKNEMGFLPAFLAHYRSIGFEQFLIWDDASTDGTFEHLSAQSDCIVMRSDLGFGQELRFTDPEGRTRVERAGTYFKIALPHLFFDNAFVAYVDADEFLILPPGVTSVAQVVDRLRDDGAFAAVASVVEFFPRGVQGLKGELPDSFQGLIAAYPHFQAEALVDLTPGALRPRLMGQSKTAHLYAQYNVTPPLIRRGWHKIWMPARVRRDQQSQTSPRHKTPLILRSADCHQVGSHNASKPPSSTVLLTLAHFVFTAQFADKITRAITQGAHAHGARKYHGYAQLLKAMEGRDDGFLDAQSVRYQGPQQLIDLGLMRW